MTTLHVAGCRHKHFNQAALTVVTAYAVAAAVLLGWLSAAGAAEEADVQVGPNPEAYKKTVDRGVQFLVTQGQAADGSFTSAMGTGPTSLAVTALLRNGRSPQDPAVVNGLQFLQSSVADDGGVYGMRGMFGNYETCAAIMCFEEANRDGAYEQLLKKAESYVRGNQWDENRDKEPADLSYGGAGYGGKSRPDLSNTAFLLDALTACGAGADDEAVQKALVFVSRCQNLETEHNTTQFAGKVNDGGFYYTPMVDRDSEERMTQSGGLRSYGSMTYAGLKSMIYAGLKEDDPRVQAAVEWIRKNYDLQSNPGMGSAGLYYYYHTFAKSLAVLGQDYVEDNNGVKHDWRRELAEELASRQQTDGSWVNTESKRWMEGDPNLATSFALLALSYCNPAGK